MRKKVLNGLLLASAVGGMLNSGISVSAENADIHIEAEATTVNMTVPGVVGMIFNENGTNTLPDNFTIRNNSAIGGIYVSGISVNANGSGWQLVNSSTDLTKVGVDTKSIKLKMGEENSLKIVNPTNGSIDSTGKAEFGINEFVIPAESEKTVKFGVERGAFSSAVTNAKAFDMGISFDWVVGESARLTSGSDFQSKIASIKAQGVSAVRFVNYIDPLESASGVDVSEGNDGSVIAYRSAESTPTLVVAFDESLELNADSSHLLEGLTMLSIEGLNLLDFSKVENASYMFANTQATYSFSNITMPNALDVSHMFEGYSGSGSNFTNLSFPKATNADSMFKNANGGKLKIGDISLPSAITAKNMFEGSFSDIGVIQFSENLKYADYMFSRNVSNQGSANNHVHDTLDLSNWGMSGVVSARYMFNGNLATKKVIMFDTSSLEDASYLFNAGSSVALDFSSCSFNSLKKADYMFSTLGTFALSLNNKTFPVLESAEGMFKNFVLVDSFNGLDTNVSNLSFPKLRNADYMLSFTNVDSKADVNLSTFSFGSLVSANDMVKGFNGASSMDLSSWDVSTLTSANNMISNMQSLKGSLGISSWDLSSLVSANNLLNTIPYLENDSITIRNKDSIISLSYIGMGTSSTSITVNYIDDETKAVAEKLVADTANERVVLGTKVQ